MCKVEKQGGESSGKETLSGKKVHLGGILQHAKGNPLRAENKESGK